MSPTQDCVGAQCGETGCLVCQLKFIPVTEGLSLVPSGGRGLLPKTWTEASDQSEVST